MTAATRPAWLYGGAGDRIPVRDGDVWRVGDHRFICADVQRDRSLLRDVVGHADMVYVDPPWNAGNARAFRTKAGLPPGAVNFDLLLDSIIALASFATSGPVFSEMGRATVNVLMGTMARYGLPVTDRWDITYYRTKPCVLLRAATTRWDGPDLTGVDDDHTPRSAIEWSVPRGAVVLDPCAGRGLTPSTAAGMGRRSVSVELHPRRLAVAIERVAEITGGRPDRLANFKEA